MIPVIINVMGVPRNPSGIDFSLSLDLIPAIAVIANAQPIPEPAAKKTVCIKLYCLETMNNETPSIAQLTVINGKNMPKA